jgi:hypothetical protein
MRLFSFVTNKRRGKQKKNFNVLRLVILFKPYLINSKITDNGVFDRIEYEPNYGEMKGKAILQRNG